MKIFNYTSHKMVIHMISNSPPAGSEPMQTMENQFLIGIQNKKIQIM